MANFWDNISQNNINNFQQQNVGRPNLLQFISQNRGKTLDQMLREYNINVSEEEINAILPEAKKILNSLRLK